MPNLGIDPDQFFAEIRREFDLLRQANFTGADVDNLCSASALERFRASVDSLSGREAWSSKDLASALLCCSTTGKFPNRTPDRIELGVIKERLDHLNELSQRRPVEHGFVGFVVPEICTVRFKTDATVGTPNRIVLNYGDMPRGLNSGNAFGAFALHSHPPKSPHGLHFSPQDFVALLASNRHFAEFLIHDGTALVSLKTSSARCISDRDELRRSLESILEDVTRAHRGNYGNTVRAFTKQVAIEFGLSLYRTTSQNPGIARKILLG